MEHEEREWTILLYMGGNNDLAPEIAKAFNTLQSPPTDTKVTVVAQVSFAEKELVKILRPFEKLENIDNLPLSGRYLIANQKAQMVEEMGICNMSNPMMLYDFIVWGVTSFPARHYMLVLGGHGYQFVGCMTDYSQNLPSIMGYVEMSNAIQSAFTKLNQELDILFLDTCYFNLIETLYEFGKYDDGKVKYILTNVVNGPLGGYNLDLLIQTIQDMKYEKEVLMPLNRIIEQGKLDMCGYEVNNKKLVHIKHLFSNLANEFYNSTLYNQISLPNLFCMTEKTLPFKDILKEINELSLGLIVCKSPMLKENQNLLNIANMPTHISEVSKQYQKLSFAKDNQWTKLLVPSNELTQDNNGYEATMLSPQAVYAFISIMNHWATELQRKNIFLELAQYKRWKIK